MVFICGRDQADMDDEQCLCVEFVKVTRILYGT